ncbi:MAG: CotH kinase family protein [Bacteroidota bacterium]
MKTSLLRLGFGLCLLLGLSTCGKRELPSVWIEGPERSSLTGRDRVDCELRYQSTSDRFRVPAHLKRRGGMSFGYDKHSYTLHLDRKIPLDFLPLDRDWVLNASYIDKTFVRHKVAYDLFRRLDERNRAARSRYVRLFYNDRYQGLYLLMEKLDASTLAIDRADRGALIIKDPPLFMADSLVRHADSSNFFEQKFPDLLQRDHNPDLHRLKAFLFKASDQAFRHDVPLLFDLDNLIDWHLMLLLTNNSDGILKNFYLYQQNSQTPFRVAIWDYDHSFGRDGDNELNLIRPLDERRSVLFRRLMALNVAGYNCRLQSRWQQLQKSHFHPRNIHRMIDQNLAQVRDELERNAERWPLDYHWYFDDNDCWEEVAIIHRYLDQRLPQIDSYLREVAASCP